MSAQRIAAKKGVYNKHKKQAPLGFLALQATKGRAAASLAKKGNAFILIVQNFLGENLRIYLVFRSISKKMWYLCRQNFL